MISSTWSGNFTTEPNKWPRHSQLEPYKFLAIEVSEMYLSQASETQLLACFWTWHDKVYARSAGGTSWREFGCEWALGPSLSYQSQWSPPPTFPAHIIIIIILEGNITIVNTEKYTFMFHENVKKAKKIFKNLTCTDLFCNPSGIQCNFCV